MRYSRINTPKVQSVSEFCSKGKIHPVGVMKNMLKGEEVSSEM